MKNLSNLELFVKVVHDGSFSATARNLNTTPSSVSRQISQLEEALGARLFQRTTRQQSLTEAGVIYFQHAQRIATELNEAERAVHRLSDTPTGSLCISAETDLAQVFIAPFLPEFVKHYPGINIQLKMSVGLIDLVDGAIDVAIRMGHLRDSSLVAKKLTSSRSVICASPTYFKQHPVPRHPQELINHNCLSFRVSSDLKQWQFKTEEGDCDVNIKGNVNVNSITFLKHMALSGVGIAMLPRWLISDELKQGKLKPLLEPFPLQPNNTPIQAVFAHSKHLPPKVRVFIDFLKQQMQAMNH